MTDDPTEPVALAVAAAERNMRMLDEALRLGDDMSTRIADHSLRLRRARRVMQQAVRLLQAGRPQAACDLLQTALAVPSTTAQEEPDR